MRRGTAIRDGYIVAAGAWCLAIALGAVTGAVDARYWWGSPLPDPYVVRDYALGYGFWFTPAIAFAMYPLTLLSWPVFAAVWTGLSFAALGILVRRWAVFALLVPVVWWEVRAGNIALLLGVAVVAGFRWPAAWAFVLLTKVTPGVGLLWFAVRREWRSLGIALAATVAIAGATAMIAPSLWLEWWDRLTANAGSNGSGYFVVPVTLPVRLAIAAVVVTWGARTNRRWTVVVAATLGTPVLWFNALAMLVAVVPLLEGRPRLWHAEGWPVRLRRHPERRVAVVHEGEPA
jgi:hypothetical protein